MRVVFIASFFLVYVSLTAQPVILEETNLPIFIIDTNGETIQDEPKIQAWLSVIDNYNGINSPGDFPNIYDGKIGIESRGHYSQILPQKPYGFETWDNERNSINVPLFDFPSENDWILLANYNDKSFIRNSLAFELFRKMGHYAPRTLHCELILNGEYQGIYVFTEKIKQDPGRVDIHNMDSDDIAGDSLSGGYIFKIDYPEGNDYWVSRYSPPRYPPGSVSFIYTDPKPKNITPEQRSYLDQFIDNFEDVLFGPYYLDKFFGYRKYLELNSFIDYFIIGEVTRNVDAYKKSCHYFKTRDSEGGLIYAGPVWDFDWAMKNFAECIYRNTDGSGWAYRIHECGDPGPYPVPPYWIPRMVTDEFFVNSVHSRYFELRKTILDESYIFNYIDSIASLLGEAQVRHYTLWPILGLNVGTPEVDEIPDSFEGEIQKLKDWFSIRLDWLDRYMIGKPFYPDDFEFTAGKIGIYPNPSSDYIHIQADTIISGVEIMTYDGKIIQKISTENESQVTVWVGNLQSGLYPVRVILANGNTYTLKLILQ